MSVTDAQFTKIFHVSDFLTNREIFRILSFIDNCELPTYTSNADEDIGPNGEALHTTMYLQSGNMFASEMSWLRSKITHLAKCANAKCNWGFNLSDNVLFNIRVAEYHEMRPGGSLKDISHYDVGSIITVDIMLHEAFEGALFQTLEVGQNGTTAIHPKENVYLQTHTFSRGDALVFVSHKYHSVSPLLQGTRKVLVIEFWSGNHRSCGHRCERPVGNCFFECNMGESKVQDNRRYKH
jgi:hypothetical protein